MSFLPNSYEVPQSGCYMKLAPGKNRFRVLGPAIVGGLFWRTNGDKREPVRRRPNEPILASELEWNAKDNAPEKVKHFWAFPVWNYAAQAVQILELTQKSIMGSIKALVDEPDWGDPQNYDIIVTRTGNGLETEYAVQPAPSKPLDPIISRTFAEVNPNMEALYAGADPFAGGGPVVEPVPPEVPPGAMNAHKAMNIAKRAFATKHPNVPGDQLAGKFAAAMASYFPGKKPELLSANDWVGFAADGFVKKPDNPISDDKHFEDDDIPF